MSTFFDFIFSRMLRGPKNSGRATPSAGSTNNRRNPLFIIGSGVLLGIVCLIAYRSKIRSRRSIRSAQPSQQLSGSTVLAANNNNNNNCNFKGDVTENENNNNNTNNYYGATLQYTVKGKNRIAQALNLASRGRSKRFKLIFSTIGSIFTVNPEGKTVQFLNDTSLELLKRLVSHPSVDTYLITKCDADETEASAHALLKQSGIFSLMSEHKSLYCSTTIGRQSIVRQLEPSIYIDTDWDVIVSLQPFVQLLGFVGEVLPPLNTTTSAKKLDNIILRGSLESILLDE